MSPPGTSSPSPNKPAVRGNKGNISTTTHSHQRRLAHLTKVGVDRAYKLHTESRRVVHIVDTQSCGNPKTFGCSNPFSSLTSALLKTSSSAPSSSSRNWALLKDSNDRRSVAARIHTLLNQWRADPSFDWRARVASVVPVLEEVVYKEAKSQEEYTNPDALESQLMNVLCHFEAGNGPFLLQGSTPLYPVRAFYPPSLSSRRMSPLRQGEGVSSHGITSEETHERAMLTCRQSSASDSSPLISTEVVHNRWDADSAIRNMCDMKVSSTGHASSKIVKKVASMLSKKRRGKGECLKEELERTDGGAEAAEGLSAHSCHGSERMRRTLGGMLKLESSSKAVPLVSTSTTTSEETLVCHTEAAPFSLSTSDEASCDMISNAQAEASDLRLTPEAGRLSDLQPSLMESGYADLKQGVDFSCELMPLSLVPSSSLSTATSTLTPPPPSSSSSSALSSASSSSSMSPPCRSMFPSPSSFSPSSSSALSASELILPHQAPLSSPSPTCSSSSSLPCFSSSSPSCSSSSLLLCFSSSSPPQQQFTHASITCRKPSPQHESPSFLQHLAPLSASSDVHSMEIRNLIHEDHRKGAFNVRTTDAQLRSHQGNAPTVQIAFEHSTTQTAPEEHREVERGESSSTSSITSSPSASNEEASKRRDKGMKLPLSSFLAEREEHLGCISSYEEGGPWDTWEEATEQMDGMCCVCMVGFKGAAFIPCGHTFCRKCTRELWRGRGTCPLCNRYIREILDIY